jgi:drug/metabolite transporter (DMT)-like permease
LSVAHDGVSGSAPLTWETARPLVPELALIAATIAYGATFKLVQDALADVTPVGFILLRFGMGAIVLLPFASRNGWRGPSTARATLRPRDFVLAALAFGVVGFAGYWFQNEGLQRTTTSNSAFITGLFVVFTPLLETAVTRRRPSLNVMIAVLFAVAGLFLLEGSTFRLHAGDALTLAGAFFFGLWILMGSYFTQHFDPIALTAGQLVVFVVLAIPVVAIGGLGHVTTQVLVAAAITGVCCSALAFTLQLWGLRFVEPSRAAVILTFEPVVAGIIGFWVGERLGVSGYVGAATIMLGIVIAESRAWWAGRLV